MTSQITQNTSKEAAARSVIPGSKLHRVYDASLEAIARQEQTEEFRSCPA